MKIGLRKFLKGLMIMLLIASIYALITAPNELSNNALAPKIVGDLESWIADRESAVDAKQSITPNTEKRVRWYNSDKNSKTRHSIVYLHGFSATRQEIAPVAEIIADALGANLFETRLAGHGHSDNALTNVRAEDWLDDAAEALVIGAAIGEKLIVIGTSTGATLAMAMTDHPDFKNVETIVQISPNYAPKDSYAEFLIWPGGPQIANLVIGDSYSWTPKDELQGKYWATRYPVDAIIEMMRLVNYARGKLPLSLSQSVLTIYSPVDEVVDANWTVTALAQIESPKSQVIEIAGSIEGGNHVLAGDILAPQNNKLIADYIIGFAVPDRL